MKLVYLNSYMLKNETSPFFLIPNLQNKKWKKDPNVRLDAQNLLEEMGNTFQLAGACEAILNKYPDSLVKQPLTNGILWN